MDKRDQWYCFLNVRILKRWAFCGCLCNPVRSESSDHNHSVIGRETVDRQMGRSRFEFRWHMDWSCASHVTQWKNCIQLCVSSDGPPSSPSGVVFHKFIADDKICDLQYNTQYVGCFFTFQGIVNNEVISKTWVGYAGLCSFHSNPFLQTPGPMLWPSMACLYSST